MPVFYGDPGRQNPVDVLIGEYGLITTLKA